NPYVVARQVHTAPLILGTWVAGGVIALLGAFVYAELAALRPEVGGQYAYLRDAYHPAVAFLYGWALLLVVQSGGMAAVAVTFARYTIELTGVVFPDWLLASVTLIILTIVNILGVRSGSNTQSVLMILKLVAIGIAISTLGFLGQSMLTAPRVYYAMAADGVFFRAVARVHPVTRVPYIAIALQGIVAIVIAISGKYEQILSYVVATDFIFFG